MALTMLEVMIIAAYYIGVVFTLRWIAWPRATLNDGSKKMLFFVLGLFLLFIAAVDELGPR